MEEICRCCACEGPSKDIISKYNWMGDEEVYSDMLKECFSVDLVHQMDYSGICEVCITQLRMAFNFKKQVLNTEEQFKRKLEELGEHKNRIKVEVQEAPSETDDNDNDHDDIPDSPDDDSDDDEFLANIKTEPEEKPKVAKKRQAKAKAPAKAKKMKVEGETSQRRTSANKHQRKSKTTADVENFETLPESKKICHNLHCILKYTNATPFKNRNVLGYTCAYCLQVFPLPNEFRTHVATEHSKHRLTYRYGRDIKNFVAYLDIHNLKCTICEQTLTDLKSVGDHLKTVHDKNYFDLEKDYLIPYILTSEQNIKCFHCNEAHEMKDLIEHMNIHYSNFICQICGKGFVNNQKLSQHELRHEDAKEKTFPCKQCDSVFSKANKLKLHVISDHKGLVGLNVCRICKCRFQSFYQKSRHMIEEHATNTFNCEYCDKSFTLRSTLAIHVRRVHLQEKKYECTECHMRFFSKIRLTEHMIVHTGDRDFSCDVCGRAFARKKTLKVHLKTHSRGNVG